MLPFSQGKTYEYRFRSQVSHALLTQPSTAILEQAVTGLQATLKLTFSNERHARVQLKNVRLGEFNGQVRDGQGKMIPSELLERREMPEELLQKLQLPYVVSIVDNVVERINFHEDDSVWSKNIKRAALNLLQLNLKRNDVQGLKLESSQPLEKDEQEKHRPTVFTIPEIMLEGECETTYTVQKQQKQTGQQQEQQQFNVTKNVDFNKCRKTSDVSYGIPVNADQQLRCLKCLRQADIKPKAVGKSEKQEELKLSACQQECLTNQLSHQKDIERSTVGRFQVQQKGEKYAVKRAQIISQYVVKAQNPQAQNTISQVVAIAELVHKESESEEPVPEIKASGKAETLQYSPEWDLNERRFYMWGDEEIDPKNSPFARVQQKAEKAAEIVQKIVKQWTEEKETGYELTTALIFNQLVQVVRQSSVPELKQIEQQILSKLEQRSPETEKHAKSLFHDALAVAATRNTMHMLEQKIKQQEIPSLKAAQLIKIFIANQHSPSDRQAEILEKIANSEAAQQCPVLKQTAWLAYGAAIGKICQTKPAQSQENHFRTEEICPESKKEQFKKTLLMQWLRADTVYDQILALKVIGNAALEKSLPELQKIVVDKRQPALIRMESIDALRRLRTSQPEKIQQTLLPIFQDQREQPEVRMAAVSMILYTQPSAVILDQIVFSVQNDRSQNVKTFVITALESLSKSPVAAEQHIAQHLKAALKFVKITPEQMRASRKYRVPIYVSEQEDTEEQNLFIGLASIVSPSNMIPVHLAASLRSAFNGDATQEKIQLSFTQKDLEHIYEKLSNLYEGFQNEDGEEMQERESVKQLRQIYSSLGIKSRRTGSYYLSSEESDDESSETIKRSNKIGSNKPFGMICLRTNDVDQMLVPIEEQQLPQLLRNFLNGKKPSFASTFNELSSQLRSGKHFQQHLAMSIAETKTKMPTSAGFPLAIVWQTSAVASVQGKIQGEFELGRREVQAELQLRSSAIATHTHKTETWSPALINGVQTTRTVELNHNLVKVKIVASTTDLRLTIVPPKEEQKERVLGLHTLPAVYTQKFNWEKRTASEPRLRVVRNFALEPMQRDFHLEDQHQSAFRFEGQIHQVRSAKKLIEALYTSENNLHIYYKPTENTPEEVMVRVTGFSFRRSERNEHQKPEFDDFYKQSSARKPFRSIYEDSDEEYKTMEIQGDNEQRHQRLTTFVQSYQTHKAYKHQLRVELKARTPGRTHEAELAFQGQCDQQMQHCKAVINMQRTPLFAHEQQNWQLQAQLQTVVPEQVRNEEEPDQKQSRALLQANAEWGPVEEKTKQQQVHVRVQAEPTRKTYWRSDSMDKWSRFLNKVDLVAEYKLASPQRHFVERFFQLAKYQYLWQLSTDTERKGEPGMIRASLLIDPITRRHANLTIQTPEERVQGKMLELPIKVQPFALERRQQQYHSFGHLIQSYTQQSAAECRADDRRVRTFDGVAYRAPMSECWTVLAKDCSRESPRFVVMMKKVGESKKVKIITPEAAIELQKKENKRDILIKVDGQQVEDEEQLQEYGIEKQSHQVEVQKRGISVRFDGEEATIKVDSIYKNIQCGLCGHYSDEEENVFRSSDNRRSQSLKDFHKSYTLKNQECEEQKYNKFYAERGSEEFQIKQKKQKSLYYRQHFYGQNEENSSEERENQWWSSSEETDASERKIRPVEQTQVLEYAQKLCFSTQPVRRCPHGTQPSPDANPTEVKTQFFCVERQSTAARRLQRQVRQGKVVDAEGHSPSFYDNVHEHTKCQRRQEFF